MTGSPARAWSVARKSTAVIVRVRLTPKSNRDRIDGLEASGEGPAVKAFVRAVPADGKANAALEALIACWLDLPIRQVVVTGGHKSRNKTVTIKGDPRLVIDRLESRLLFRSAAPQEP